MVLGALWTSVSGWGGTIEAQVERGVEPRYEVRLEKSVFVPMHDGGRLSIARTLMPATLPLIRV